MQDVKNILFPKQFISQFLKCKTHWSGEVEKPTVLLFATMEVTGPIIDYNIIHSGLGMNWKGQFYPLNGK